MRTLEELYALIPDMDCIPGCIACCGHIPWSREEYDRLPEEFKGLEHQFQSKCGLAKRGVGCIAHKYRPLICRLFGVVRGMPCPAGIKVDRVLEEEEAAEIAKEYIINYMKESLEGDPLNGETRS